MRKSKLNIEKPKVDVVNGLPLYNLSDTALKIYRKEAKNFNNLDELVLKRKLTAMILTVKNSAKQIFDSCIYNFLGFKLIVNELTKTIEVVYWCTEEHSPVLYSKDITMTLKENYKLLGLSGSGNTIIFEQNTYNSKNKLQ